MVLGGREPLGREVLRWIRGSLRVHCQVRPQLDPDVTYILITNPLPLLLPRSPPPSASSASPSSSSSSDESEPGRASAPISISNSTPFASSINARTSGSAGVFRVQCVRVNRSRRGRRGFPLLAMMAWRVRVSGTQERGGKWPHGLSSLESESELLSDPRERDPRLLHLFIRISKRRAILRVLREVREVREVERDAKTSGVRWMSRWRWRRVVEAAKAARSSGGSGQRPYCRPLPFRRESDSRWGV